MSPPLDALWCSPPLQSASGSFAGPGQWLTAALPRGSNRGPDAGTAAERSVRMAIALSCHGRSHSLSGRSVGSSRAPRRWHNTSPLPWRRVGHRATAAAAGGDFHETEARGCCALDKMRQRRTKEERGSCSASTSAHVQHPRLKREQRKKSEKKEHYASKTRATENRVARRPWTKRRHTPDGGPVRAHPVQSNDIYTGSGRGGHSSVRATATREKNLTKRSRSRRAGGGICK